MPRYCDIPECRKEQKQRVFPVPIYKFPKNPEILQCWLDNINRPLWKPNPNSVLCENHFRDDDFRMIPTPSNSKSNYKLKELKETAVPTIFPNSTNYNSISSQHVELKNAAEPEPESIINKREEDDVIINFGYFKLQSKTKLNLEKYYRFENDDKCVFCLIENTNDTECMITVRISVNSSMIIRILIGDSENTRYFEQLGITNNKLIKWSQIEYLLNAYRNGATKDDSENINYECLLKHALEYLKLSKNISKDCADGNRLDIIINQLEIIGKKTSHPLYNSGTMKLAFLLYSHSYSTLDILGKFMHLPESSTIRQMSSNIFGSTNFDITTRKDRDLSDPENYVALIIDELYIDRGQQYTDEKIASTPILNMTHDPKKLVLDTKTILSFTIKSIFGDLHEIFRMSPAIYPIGDVVYTHTKDALHYIQNLGFKVKVLLADTSKNSQSIFKRFSDKNHYFTNPKFIDNQIYFQFDILYILKDILSDWRNLINADRTFIYPDIETFEKKNASFVDLELLLESDKLNTVKKAPKLTEATLKSEIDNDRQNITLVGNIFDESTILALRKHNKNGTADFCETIKKWWDIVVTDDPILSCSDQRLRFLEKFSKWIETWKFITSNPGRLSPSTYHAINTTTKTLIELIKFSFLICQADFFQLAKLQKDSLENRMKFYESKMKPIQRELVKNSEESNIDVEMVSQDNDEGEWETEYLEEENIETNNFNVTACFD